MLQGDFCFLIFKMTNGMFGINNILFWSCCFDDESFLCGQIFGASLELSVLKTQDRTPWGPVGSEWGINVGCEKESWLKEAYQTSHLFLSWPSSCSLYRLIHQPSGRSYHEEFNPPKEPMKDDVSSFTVNDLFTHIIKYTTYNCMFCFFLKGKHASYFSKQPSVIHLKQNVKCQ